MRTTKTGMADLHHLRLILQIPVEMWSIKNIITRKATIMSKPVWCDQCCCNSAGVHSCIMLLSICFAKEGRNDITVVHAKSLPLDFGNSQLITSWPNVDLLCII